MRQLNPGRGKTRQAYMLAYCSGTWEGGPPIVIFDYQESRAGKHVRDFLHDWRGHLMVDDYAGYKGLYANGPIKLARLAHIRRKFVDLQAANGSLGADEAQRRLAQFYVIEQDAATITAPLSLALRSARALSALAEVHA